MSRPSVQAAAAWQFPTPTVMRLDSGLTVWHFHLPGQHIATFELVLPTALDAEPTSKEGVGTVALHAIDEGTISHPDGMIGELLELQGATLHGTARHRYTTLGGQAPSRRLSHVLPLFAEVLREPAYAEHDVAHHVEAQVAGYESKLASPGATTRIALRRELFGADQRDGRLTGGTPETLLRLTADDARTWHRAAFTPVGATLIVAGDIEDVPVLDWASDAAPPMPPPAPARVAPRLVVVDRPGSVQANVSAACRTVSRGDARWPALRIAGHAMAGAFASRLNLELRERLGYTYGINGGFAAGVAEGQFSVGGSFRTEVAADAVARITQAVALDDGFSPTETDDARRFLIDVAPLANETSADIVAQASALAAAGLGADYMVDHLAALGQVTAEAASEAFREAVQPEGLTIAITGDAEQLLPALRGIGLAPELVTL